MSFIGLLSQPVTIAKAGTTTNGAGDSMPTWDSGVTEVDTIGYVEGMFASSEESDFLREAAISKYRVFLQPDEDVTQSDRIYWGGKILEVVGMPKSRYQPYAMHHLEVEAVEYQG